MGQKTHPYGFRLGYNKPWKSRWYADREYADLLHEDVKLRKELKERLKSAGVSSIDVERAAGEGIADAHVAIEVRQRQHDARIVFRAIDNHRQPQPELT